MDEVEEIKRRVDIVDLISSYLTLKKAGANYRALCPFHQEKTPSLMVSPEKQIFKCFGCSEAGDIFGFVMKMENLEFREALEMLAQRAGVQLQRRSKESFRQAQEIRENKTRLFQINNLSAQVFHKILISHPAGRPALNYLKSRGLTDLTIKTFLLGYAPAFAKATADKPSYLVAFLKDRGFQEEEIISAGSPHKFYRRIIFPIRDIIGNIIAFTGRVLDSNSPTGGPKYLNTPETTLYHKGRMLYNLDKARGEIKLHKATVLVEGQMDVIASWQAGVKNIVACSGTALTDEHLKILYRYNPNVIFAFDSDNAGLASAKKAFEMAIQEAMNVKMANLGEYKDPGEMIAKSPALWQETVENAQPVIDWYFNLAFGEKSEIRNPKSEITSQEKKEIAKEILPIIKIIPDSIEQAHYVHLLAKKLEVREEIIFDALSRANRKSRDVGSVTQKLKKPLKPTELLLAILIKNPKKLVKAGSKIQTFNWQDDELGSIYKELEKVYNTSKTDNKEFLKELSQHLNRETKIRLDSLLLIYDEFYKDGEDIEEDFRQVIQHLETDKKESLKNYYAEQIKEAESKRDYESLKKLIKEFQNAISEK